MGVFLRKSRKIGPFRINFSSSGVGVSAGITGARVSVGPRGTFVHLGRNGLYYRKKISSNKSNKSSTSQFEEVNLADVFKFSDNETLISTSNFEGITDAESSDFIKSLESQNRKIFFYKWLGIIPSILFLLFLLIYNGRTHTNSTANQNLTKTENFFRINTEAANLREGPSAIEKIIEVSPKNSEFLIIDDTQNWIKIEVNEGSVGYVHNSVGETIPKEIPIEIKNVNLIESRITRLISPYWLLVSIPWIIFLSVVDRKRKQIEIYYSMDEEFSNLYDLNRQYFAEFKACNRVWHKTSSKSVQNYKYHGGAGNLVNRIPVKKISTDSLPTELIKTNVEIPHISLTNIDLYFFPERLVLKRENSFAGVFYKNIEITGGRISFIEDELLPKDASVIDKTWKYVNKNGGPDRRFRNNKQLPVCEYSEYHFRSRAGLNEVIMTSKIDGMKSYSNFIMKIGNLQSKFHAKY